MTGRPTAIWGVGIVLFGLLSALGLFRKAPAPCDSAAPTADERVISRQAVGPHFLVRATPESGDTAPVGASDSASANPTKPAIPQPSATPSLALWDEPQAAPEIAPRYPVVASPETPWRHQLDTVFFPVAPSEPKQAMIDLLPDATPPARPWSAPPERTHRVIDGDSLTALASRYLGDASRHAELYELNRDRLTNPDVLPIGLELRLPR